jgi:hypothetical protein
LAPPNSTSDQCHPFPSELCDDEQAMSKLNWTLIQVAEAAGSKKRGKSNALSAAKTFQIEIRDSQNAADATDGKKEQLLDEWPIIKFLFFHFFLLLPLPSAGLFASPELSIL